MQHTCDMCTSPSHFFFRPSSCMKHPKFMILVTRPLYIYARQSATLKFRLSHAVEQCVLEQQMISTFTTKLRGILEM